MAQPKNPYYPGSVVKPDQFIGRKEHISLIQNRLINTENVDQLVIYGPRRIGKTSLLIYAEDWFTKQGITTIYFNLHDKPKEDIAQVAYELAQKIAEGTSVKPRKDEFEGKRRADVVEVFVKHLESFHAKGVLPRIIAFDEFDVLDDATDLDENMALHQFFPFLRDVQSRFKKSRISYIFANGRLSEESAKETLSRPDWKDALSTRLWVMDKLHTFQIIQIAEEKGFFKFSDEAKEAIYEESFGHPYITQTICFKIFEDVLNKRQLNADYVVKAEDVTVATDPAVSSAEEGLKWFWHGIVLPQRIVLSALAQALGDKQGTVTINKIEAEIRSESERLFMPNLSDVANNLVENEFLYREDNRYGYTIRFLQRWISRKRPLSSLIDAVDRKVPLAQTYYSLGHDAANQKNFEKAISHYRDALQVNPEHFPSLRDLGIVLLKLKKTEEAVNYFERAYPLGKKEIEEHLVEAKFLLFEKKTDLETKLEIIESILGINPNNQRALELFNSLWIDKGNNLLKQEKFADAKAAFEKGGDQELAIQANNELQIQRKEIAASLAFEKGDIERFIDLKKELSGQFRSHRHYAEWVANVKKYENRIREIDNQEKIVTQAISEGNLPLARGSTKLLIDNYQEFKLKVSEWRTQLDDIEQDINLGESFKSAQNAIEDEKFDSAIEICHQIMTTRPNFTLSGLGVDILLDEADYKKHIRMVHEGNGEWEKAIDAYATKRAEARSSERRDVWQQEIERCQLEQEKADKFAAGLGLMEQGEWAKAEQTLTRVVALDPLYEQDGLAAVWLLNHAIPNRVTTGRQLFEKGRRYAKEGNRTEAIAALSGVIAYDPAYKQDGDKASWLLDQVIAKKKPKSLFYRAGVMITSVVVIMLAGALIMGFLIRIDRFPQSVAHLVYPSPLPTPTLPESTTSSGAIVVTVIVSGTPQPVVVTATPTYSSPTPTDTSIPAPTAVPIPTENIVTTNTNQVGEWFRYPLGNGRFNKISFAQGGEFALVPSSAGIYLYESNKLEIPSDFDDTDSEVTQVDIVPVENNNGSNLEYMFAASLANGKLRIGKVGMDLTGYYRFTEEEFEIEVTVERLNSIAFSSDGKVLALSSSAKNIFLLCVNGDTPFSIRNPDSTAEVKSLSFSGDGRFLAAGSSSGEVFLWEIQSIDCAGEGAELLLKATLGHSGVINAVAFSPKLSDLRLATASSDGSVKIWSPEKGEEIDTLDVGRPVNDISFSPDGSRLAAVSDGNTEEATLQVWQVRNGLLDDSVLLRIGNVNGVSFEPNGTYLLAVSSYGVMARWPDLSDPDQKFVERTAEINDIDVINFGEDVIIAAALADDTIQLRRVQDPMAPPVILEGHEDTINSVNFFPTSGLTKTLVSGSDDQSIIIWDVIVSEKITETTGISRTVKSLGYRVIDSAVSHDGIYLAAALDYEEASDYVEVWSGEEFDISVFNQKIARVDLDSGWGEVNCIAFSPNNHWLGIGAGDGYVHIYDIDSGEKVAQFGEGISEVKEIDFSRDGSLLAAGYENGTVQIWEVNSDDATPVYNSPIEASTNVTAIVFTGGEEQEVLAIGLPGGRISLLRLDDKTSFPLPVEHTGDITAIAFSPDGRFLISGSTDATMVVWAVGGEVIRR